MARRFLSDSAWNQLQAIMIEKGCYDAKNSRNVIEAILWKLRTGSPWRFVPEELCPWQTAFNRFNRWSEKGLWNGFFLAYEAKLIRNGCSPTELIFELTNMRAELEEEPNEQSDDLGVEILQRFIWSPMRMEIRSILKSLGVKSPMLKQRQVSSAGLKEQST